MKCIRYSLQLFAFSAGEPRPYTDGIRKLYDFVGLQRKINVAAYKDMNFEIRSDDFCVVDRTERNKAWKWIYI